MVKLFLTKLWKNGLQRFPSDVKMSENLITVKSCRKKTKKRQKCQKSFCSKHRWSDVIKPSVLYARQKLSSSKIKSKLFFCELTLAFNYVI